MRSRYTAYCLKLTDYLIATHYPHPDGDEAEQIAAFANAVHFTGLQILSSKQQSDKGQVHFIASYLHGSYWSRLEEESDFIYQDGKWYYVSGKLHPRPDQKISRNDPCPCGSQKKFKQCAAHNASGNHPAQAASV